MTSPLSGDAIDLLRVHKAMFATCNMTDPTLIVSGASPTRGHMPILVVVGDSVLIVGSLVGPVFCPLVGAKVGMGVGANVVL